MSYRRLLSGALSSLLQNARPFSGRDLAALGVALLLSTGALTKAAHLWVPDLWFNYLKQPVTTIPQGDGAVVVTFSPDDQIRLRKMGRPFEQLPRFDENPGGWREAHAAVIDALSQGGARVIALDVLLRDRASDGDEALRTALLRARSRGTAVVLAVDGGEGETARDLLRFCVPALATAHEDSWFNRVKSARLVGVVPGRGTVPALFLQAYALKQIGEAATVDGGRIARPRGLLAGDRLWLRWADRPPTTLSYSDVVALGPAGLKDRVGARAVFIAGAWDGKDVHQVPFVPLGQAPHPPSLAGTSASYGGFIHAHAFNQLEQRSFAWTPGLAAQAAFVGIVVCMGLAPVIVLRWQAAVRRQDGTPEDLPFVTLRWSDWAPWAGLAAVSIVAPISWAAPSVMPTVTATLAGLTAAWRAGRAITAMRESVAAQVADTRDAARLLKAAVARVNDAYDRGHGRRLVHLKLATPKNVLEWRRALRPASTPDDFEHCVKGLYFVLGEGLDGRILSLLRRALSQEAYSKGLAAAGADGSDMTVVALLLGRTEGVWTREDIGMGKAGDRAARLATAGDLWQEGPVAVSARPDLTSLLAFRVLHVLRNRASHTDRPGTEKDHECAWAVLRTSPPAPGCGVAGVLDRQRRLLRLLADGLQEMACSLERPA